MNSNLRRALKRRGYLLAGNQATRRYTLIDPTTKKVVLFEGEEHEVVSYLEASPHPIRHSKRSLSPKTPKKKEPIDEMSMLARKAVQFAHYRDSSEFGRETLLEDSNAKNVGILRWDDYDKSRWSCNCDPWELKSREIGRRLLIQNQCRGFQCALSTTYTFQIFLGRVKLIEVEYRLSSTWNEAMGFSPVDARMSKLWVSHAEKFEGRDIPISYNHGSQPSWDWKLALMEWLPDQDILAEGLERIRAMEVLSEL